MGKDSVSEAEKRRLLRLRETHRGIAKKLLEGEKEVVLKIEEPEGQGISKIPGIIRRLGSAELWRSFQAEGVEFNQLKKDAAKTWAVMLVTNQLISRSFVANDGRTFSVEELDQFITTGECDRNADEIAGEILKLSHLTIKETKATQDMKSFRSNSEQQDD